MPGRAVIGQSSYGPAEVKALGEAFDKAWVAVAARVGSDPTAVEAAQIVLANLVLAHGATADAAAIAAAVVPEMVAWITKRQKTKRRTRRPARLPEL